MSDRQRQNTHLFGVQIDGAAQVAAVVLVRKAAVDDGEPYRFAAKVRKVAAQQLRHGVDRHGCHEAARVDSQRRIARVDGRDSVGAAVRALRRAGGARERAPRQSNQRASVSPVCVAYRLRGTAVVRANRLACGRSNER